MLRHFRLLFCGFFLLGGCATSGNFTPYKGPQNNWTTSQGATVRRDCGPLPVYEGYPPRPYEILGSMNVSSARLPLREILTEAGTKMQQQGADALICLKKSREKVGDATPPSSYRSPLGSRLPPANNAPGLGAAQGSYGYSAVTSAASSNLSTPVYENDVQLIVIKLKHPQP